MANHIDNAGIHEMYLSGEQTIQQIGALKNEITQALQEHDQLALNVTDVSRADLTFLQLLCSAHRTATMMKKRLSVVNLSQGIEMAVADAGFVRDDMGCGQECADSCLWLEH